MLRKSILCLILLAGYSINQDRLEKISYFPKKNSVPSYNCKITAPSPHALNLWQKKGLDLVGAWQGRDLVLAIDLTGSVAFNDEGRYRLKQLIQDSLRKGDSVYILPFSNQINPLEPESNIFEEQHKFVYSGKKSDSDKILNAIPFNSSNEYQQADIQLAEHAVYSQLAQLNQCRANKKEAVRAQSIIWITDAPLMTEAGISSDIWKETPKNSPFRNAQSKLSIQREAWLSKTPISLRTLEIENYQFSVVDIPARVQEYCTPAHGGRESCIVDEYLRSQLLLPISIFGASFIAIGILFTSYLKYLKKIRTPWKLRVSQENSPQNESTYTLKNGTSIKIGGDSGFYIECQGSNVYGYIYRQKNKLLLKSNKSATLMYQGKKIKNELKIDKTLIRLSYITESSEYGLKLKIIKG